MKNSMRRIKAMEDYKERFITEYVELRERYRKLRKMLIRHEAGTLDFKPSCPIELLLTQAKAMAEYLNVLEIRAEYEGIEFPD